MEIVRSAGGGGSIERGEAVVVPGARRAGHKPAARWYRGDGERAGMVHVVCKDAGDTSRVLSQMKVVVR